MGAHRQNPVAMLARRGEFLAARALKIKTLVRTEAALAELLAMFPVEQRAEVEAAVRALTDPDTAESGSKPIETPAQNEPRLTT